MTLNVNVRPAFSLFTLFLRTQIEAAPHSLTQKMASILTDRVRSILKVTKAVALGYLSRAVNKDMKMTMNHMVAQLSTRSVRPAVVHTLPSPLSATPAHTERGLSISGSQQVGDGTHCARFVVALGSVLAMRRDVGSDVWTPRTRRGL